MALHRGRGFTKSHGHPFISYLNITGAPYERVRITDPRGSITWVTLDKHGKSGRVYVYYRGTYYISPATYLYYWAIENNEPTHGEHTTIYIDQRSYDYNVNCTYARSCDYYYMGDYTTGKIYAGWHIERRFNIAGGTIDPVFYGVAKRSNKPSLATNFVSMYTGTTHWVNLNVRFEDLHSFDSQTPNNNYKYIFGHASSYTLGNCGLRLDHPSQETFGWTFQGFGASVFVPHNTIKENQWYHINCEFSPDRIALYVYEYFPMSGTKLGNLVCSTSKTTGLSFFTQSSPTVFGRGFIDSSAPLYTYCDNVDFQGVCISETKDGYDNPTWVRYFVRAATSDWSAYGIEYGDEFIRARDTSDFGTLQSIHFEPGPVVGKCAKLFVDDVEEWTVTTSPLMKISSTLNIYGQAYGPGDSYNPSERHKFTLKAYILDNGVVLGSLRQLELDNHAYPNRKSIDASFTSTQDWIVPTGVYSIDAFLVGGGGGGGGGRIDYNPETESYNSPNGGGGGAGGLTRTYRNISVIPGQSIKMTIGAGGSGGAKNVASPQFAGAGGRTQLKLPDGTLYSADGGAGGQNGGSAGNVPAHGGNGGSGAGAGHVNRTLITTYGGNGGTNGGDGHDSGSTDLSSSEYRGKGQGTTTKLFGEASGAVYADGGGGGATSSAYGLGGGDNGGRGGYSSSGSVVAPRSGSANSGSGGGGGAANTYGNSSNGASGGSGYIKVRCVS